MLGIYPNGAFRQEAIGIRPRPGTKRDTKERAKKQPAANEGGGKWPVHKYDKNIFQPAVLQLRQQLEPLRRVRSRSRLDNVEMS